MKVSIMFINTLFFLILLACGEGKTSKESMPQVVDSQAIKSNNLLTMKINGQPWSADNNIIAAFHPKGYNKLIMIAGSLGKKDKNEKTFNINIYNTSGIGNYAFVQGNTDLSEVQMGNWTAEDYICGNVLGFDMKVNVTKTGSDPTVVEATFSGTLTCPSGPALVITEGKFYYHE
jgi:hypothetical protein